MLHRHQTSPYKKGRSVVIKGYKKAGISDVLDGTPTARGEDSSEEIFSDEL